MTLEELERYGLETMREEEIEAMLASHSVGVLGLPAEDMPYLVPLSYAYDDDSLYFTYLLGKESRKERLTEAVERGRFLVYDANSMFRWESVVVDGTFRKVPPSEWGDLAEVLAEAWRPRLFETASTARHVSIYAFDIVETSGIKQTDLPPGMQQR